MCASDNYLIIRTSFRPAVWDYPTAYTNVFTSADYVDIIAQEIATCLDIGLSGIIHIGTPKKTLYELALRRNPHVLPEELPVSQRRDFSIKKWEHIKSIQPH
jgi:dTDP-4-dehydrorhamnose reductase